MQIVIEIPEENYQVILTKIILACRGCSIIKLPKGHGRLIDADRTLAKAWTDFYKHEDEWEKKDNDYLSIGRFYDQNGFECCQQTIVNAPTIIDADTAESED